VRSVAGEPTTEEFGEALVENGMITAEQRDWAMGARDRAGTSLSVVLVSSGLVKRLDLFRVLAELSHVPFVDLVETPPDPQVLTGLDEAQLIGEGWIPVRELEDGRLLVAVAHVGRPALVIAAVVQVIIGITLLPPTPGFAVWQHLVLQ
jgi:MshEN domain